MSFSDLFASPTGALGRTSVVKHAIQKDEPPVKQQLRCIPDALKAAAKEEVQKMLNQGVVRPSSSRWSSPTVLARKKNGAWRFCVDVSQSQFHDSTRCLPTATDWCHLGCISRCTILHYIRPGFRLLASGVRRACQDDHLFNAIWALRVHLVWSMLHQHFRGSWIVSWQGYLPSSASYILMI